VHCPVIPRRDTLIQATTARIYARVGLVARVMSRRWQNWHERTYYLSITRREFVYMRSRALAEVNLFTGEENMSRDERMRMK